MVTAYPGDRKRKVLRTIAVLVVVICFGLCAVLFVALNKKADRLERKVTQQSAQIASLHHQLDTVNANLGAAVACLQTIGALQGLCTQLVK